MLAEVLTQVATTVALMLAIAIPLVVGVGRLWSAIAGAPTRIRQSWPVIVVIIAVLLANRLARQELPSGIIRLSGLFYSIEADFVLWVQTIAREELIYYFSFIYIFGYVFLLVFPVVAYFALSRMEPFQKLLVAYTLNYTIGPIIYVLVLAFGPRNVIPELETVLYDFQPRYQHLTREVNRNTNVFPSLHTSLSMTIAIFAYHTRDRYPLWCPVAAVMAVSVAASTVYLAIHWVSDVAAGIVLAVLCVAIADRVVDDWRLVERTRRTAADRWRESSVHAIASERWHDSRVRSTLVVLRERWRQSSPRATVVTLRDRWRESRARAIFVDLRERWGKTWFLPPYAPRSGRRHDS